jgi:predicted molibdopterin-dependent oxidoreductase YjgC
VVLPATTFAEKEGTFSNTERRVARVRQAIRPIGDSRPDWQIIAELSRRLGYPMDYANPEAIFEEIRQVTPSYAGITYATWRPRAACNGPAPPRIIPAPSISTRTSSPGAKGHSSPLTIGIRRKCPMPTIP